MGRGVQPRTKPTFSVGEYDWGAHGAQRGWVWHTATTPAVWNLQQRLRLHHPVHAARTTRATSSWYGFGPGIGMVGDNTDGQPWKQRAVTFLENHDTGYRTNQDGTPEKDHEIDSFANNWEVEQAYAYILTHPGVPWVYWKHYFDWGADLRNKIRALINARKVAGVHAEALCTPKQRAVKGVYAARVVGRNGDLYVRIGGEDAELATVRLGLRELPRVRPRRRLESLGGSPWKPRNSSRLRSGQRCPYPTIEIQRLLKSLMIC